MRYGRRQSVHQRHVGHQGPVLDLHVADSSTFTGVDEGSEIACTMHKSDDRDHILGYLIDEPVSADEQSANPWIVILGNEPAALRKFTQRFSRLLSLDGERGGITWRIVRDVFGRLQKRVNGRFGPIYFVRHFAKRR